MYIAGKGIKFYTDEIYTAICADMSAISSELNLSSYATLSDVLSVQPGDTIIKTILSNNIYTICADISALSA